MQHRNAQSLRARLPLSLIHAAARLYYENNLSQEEIASQLRVSQSKVSRLLQQARELGMVRIEVRPPTQPQALAEELASRLGLARADVIPPTAEPVALSALRDPVGKLLSSLCVTRGSVLALGWGRTVHEIVRAGLPSLPGVTIVPATGGMDEAAVYFQPNEIVRLAAAGCGGVGRFLHAPAMVSAAMRESMTVDAAFQQTLALWDRIDVALVGIGAPPQAKCGYGPAFAVAEYERSLAD